MTLKYAFVRLLFTHCLPVTIVGLLVSVPYLLLSPAPLEANNAWVLVFLLAHCIALATRLGHMQGASTEFLYTQGYTRDQIWTHLMASTVLCVLAVWLPMALCLWLGIRSNIQDHVIISPYYPLLGAREMALPLSWLCVYALLLPMFHYVWIRRAQPTKGRDGALLIAVGLVVVAGTLVSFRQHADWFKGVTYVLFGIMTLTALWAGRVLHRTMEVQP
jgi:ABC-type antimicrobial peptide transport system permease subunit